MTSPHTTSCVKAKFHASVTRKSLKLAFHDADTDTDTDILADILARIVARMSACRSACHRNDFRKSRVSDVSATILARMSVSMSALWNASLKRPYPRGCDQFHRTDRVSARSAEMKSGEVG